MTKVIKAELVGWTLSIIGTIFWVFGYFSFGTAALVDWPAVAPSWIAEFLPNLESEIGFAFMIAGSIPIYWPKKRTAEDTSSPEPQ